MSLAQYSGMTAKIRAMEGRLFDTADYQALAAEQSVPAAVGFLKRHPGYAELFSGADDTAIHREQLEEMLSDSLLRDFTKLYRFANPSQRRFLSLYFMRFEAAFIKTCLRYLYDEKKERPENFGPLPYFKHYSKLNIAALWSAESFEELLGALEGSIWKKRLTGVVGRENTTLFDYEMTLDLACFSSMWKEKDRLPDKAEIDVITAMFGSKIDMINLQWIYRAKKFYRLTEAEIYALLIPVHYKLSEAQLGTLVRAANVQEFSASLAQTHYAGMLHLLEEQPSTENLEAVFDQIILKLYRDASRRKPYSAASMNYYLYRKEMEINSITSIIEGIRYGMDPAANLNAAWPIRQNRR